MDNQGIKATILLADDSKLVRFTAGKVLGGEFELLLVEDGQRAWDKLVTDSRIQLVLSDLQMPVLDGFGLLQKIRQSEDERLSRLPVIVITGAESLDGPKQRAMDLGATDFIAKPFDHAHLKARVRAHIGHQQQTRSLLEQANIDTVTGLLNRQGFEKRLAKDAAFVSRHHHSLALMLIQLDRYKPLFEQIGRSGYDNLMRRIAKLLLGAVRKEDTVGRAGLAQFLISLPTAHPDSTSELVHRLAASVEACEIRVNGEHWSLSLSIGVFSSPRGSVVDAETALQKVREALEQSQAQGNRRLANVTMPGSAVPARISLDQLLETGQLPRQVTPEQLLALLKPLVALLPEPQRQALLE